MSYFNRQGAPISLDEWIGLVGDDAYKRLALTELPDGTRVSTVWLGLDHSLSGKTPLIFETMSFPGDEHERYTTEAAALEGHAAWVVRLGGGH